MSVAPWLGSSVAAPLRADVTRDVHTSGSRDTSSTFSSFRSVCTSVMECKKASDATNWSAKACTQPSGSGLYLFAFTYSNRLMPSVSNTMQKWSRHSKKSRARTQPLSPRGSAAIKSRKMRASKRADST
jgi:hypothetical protein